MSNLVVVVKGYPRLSETFVAQELLGLERAGMRLTIVSLRRPTDTKVHATHRLIQAPVAYLCEYLHQEPLRVLRALLRMRRRAGFRPALRAFVKDLRRDLSRNRVRRFGQAVVLAAEFPAGADSLYAHFIHTPASVARYASLILGLPWSCSAHAKDIWTTPDWDLAEKLAEARWTVTCTRAGQARLNRLAPADKPVELLYHGLDLARFAPLAAPRSARDGHDADAPVRLLTVGRAVEKKGLDLLLDALAQLPSALHWRLAHIGGGPLRDQLAAQARRLGLEARIDWLGAQDQDTVLAHYRAADLFCLPCRVAGDGDRDGLPNVLVEALSQGLACVSTRVSGVPELIEDGRTGCLVEPDDAAVLAEALAGLIADPARRRRLGKAGAELVRARFDYQASVDRLATLLSGPVLARPRPRLAAAT